MGFWSILKHEASVLGNAFYLGIPHGDPLVRSASAKVIITNAIFMGVQLDACQQRAAEQKTKREIRCLLGEKTFDSCLIFIQ